MDEENGINELHKHIAHLKSETKMQDVFFVARLDCYYYYVLFIISETIFILTFKRIRNRKNHTLHKFHLEKIFNSIKNY